MRRYGRSLTLRGRGSAALLRRAQAQLHAQRFTRFWLGSTSASTLRTERGCISAKIHSMNNLFVLNLFGRLLCVPNHFKIVWTDVTQAKLNFNSDCDKPLVSYIGACQHTTFLEWPDWETNQETRNTTPLRQIKQEPK